MSPTYNNHFRQFTKKASKTAVSSALGATRSHRRSFVDYAGDDAPAKSRTLFCLGWHFNYNMTKAHKIDWATLDYASSTYTGRVKIGPLLIQWGRGSAYVPSGAPGESSELSITFPKAYSVAPTVLLQMEDIGGICGEYAVLFNTTTSGFTGAIGHTLDAVAGTKYYRWLAIGTTS